MIAHTFWWRNITLHSSRTRDIFETFQDMKKWKKRFMRSMTILQLHDLCVISYIFVEEESSRSKLKTIFFFWSRSYFYWLRNRFKCQHTLMRDRKDSTTSLKICIFALLKSFSLSRLQYSRIFEKCFSWFLQDHDFLCVWFTVLDEISKETRIV